MTQTTLSRLLESVFQMDILLLIKIKIVMKRLIMF